ncbi:secretion protein HlyD [Planctomycetales bacterium]|nr:secretion protein HlyD [Planctomycetales bacterium]GHT35369.1 secretion protein HlyD [Planctomycetales bacterium]
MLKRIVFILLLITSSIGGYFAWQYYISTHTSGTDETLTLYGNVEIRRVNLGFRVAGRIADIRFEEGEFIKKNELIVQLDKEPFQDLYDVAAAQLEQSKAIYEKMTAGNRPQEIEQARTTVNERTATLKVLESDFRRAEELVKNKTMSEQEHETVKTRRDEALARKKFAEENLNLLAEGFRKEDIAAAKAELSEAAANLKKAQTALKDTELHCPNDGILLTRVEEIGAVVNTGQTVATLSLQDAVWVYVYISETELGKIAPNMKAAIYTDTKPDKPYWGHIGYISPEAEFTPKNVETTELRTSLVYRVRVIADNPDNGLRQGMPVTVKIMQNCP